MSSRLSSFLLNFLALVAMGAALTYFFSQQSVRIPLAQQMATTTQTAAVIAPVVAATSSATKPPPVPRKAAVKPVVAKPVPTAATTTPQSSNLIARIQNPYPFAPLSADAINAGARAALVNILCMPRSGSLSPVSGSGVIIDPRGIILTNAHVAQYVLLSQDPRVDLGCAVRTGAPASARWSARVLYLPPVWVNAHASELLDRHPAGTGEHDYAFLLITDTIDGTSISPSFPYLQSDTRSAIAFQGDSVLVASYPAEFLGGITATFNLFPASSITTIGQLMTFGTGAPDVLSLGGIIEAQNGSSGGAVVNAWGRLVGLISTTSSGETTAQRDLHALALSYIDKDLKAQSGSDLAAWLQGDVASELQQFSAQTAPDELQQLIAQITKPR